ncbi:MAG: hypothetical protein Q7S58_10180 [Candidatus Binatus sp.]|uniref:hypothetical protein n=1 Tax=Candidatus Binatus sp. TaxID=2811406 RepID=UPI002727305D|nr:hypothetical protein [Candidatus Binatus sp.]MDO8432759.1 hypothetical protein [Candidatus Binatus sp.]
MDYKLEHKCDRIRAPQGWTAVYTLSHMKDGTWHVHKFANDEPTRVFATEQQAKERNWELAKAWLVAEDPDGQIFE